MLYIHYTETDNTIRCPDGYFNHVYEDDWMKDDFVKEMVKAVDKSDVIDVDCVRSPVLGTIPVTKYRAGSKR